MKGTMNVKAFGVLEAVLDLVAVQLAYLDIALKLFGSSPSTPGG
jgi:hypothetical protein